MKAALKFVTIITVPPQISNYERWNLFQTKLSILRPNHNFVGFGPEYPFRAGHPNILGQITNPNQRPPTVLPHDSRNLVSSMQIVALSTLQESFMINFIGMKSVTSPSKGTSF